MPSDLENRSKIYLLPEDLESGLISSGSNSKYHLFMIFIIFFLKIVTDSFMGPLPFLLMDPKINCYNSSTQSYTQDCVLRDVCKYNDQNPNTPIKYELSKEDKYQKKDFSFVTYFDLFCDTYILGLLGSAGAFGNLLCNILTPILTDNLGRIKTIMFVLIFDIIIKIILFFVPNGLSVFFILIFISLTNNIVYGALSLYIHEMTESSKRGTYSLFMNSLFGITGIIFTIIYNVSFSWKAIQIFSVSASIISLILIFFMRESIRYLYQKNKQEEIIASLAYIAKFNGRMEQHNAWKREILLRGEPSEQLIHQTEDHTINKINPILLIFKKKQVISDFLIFSLISLVIISGITYNAIDIKTAKDTLVYPIIFYLADFLIILFTGFIIDLPMFGRKKPAIFASIVACIFYFVKFIIQIQNNSQYSVFAIDIIVRMSVSIAFNILMQYNFEIYSTDIRSTAFNINKLISRIGDASIPIIIYQNRPVTTMILCVGYGIMTGSIFFLKETRGVMLKESVYDDDKDAGKVLKFVELGNEEEFEKLNIGDDGKKRALDMNNQDYKKEFKVE